MSQPSEDSKILAEYHEALLDGSSSACDAERDDLRGAMQMLRIMERNRQLSQRAAGDSGESESANQSSSEHQLGRFRIVQRLGRGGNGVVFLACDPQLQREVALKVPNPDSLFNPEFSQRFEREAKLTAVLRHPNIVSVYEAGLVGPIAYIASAYCAGGTLAQWLEGRNRPISPRAAVLLVSELADAVQHAHSRGVLHRDIKPWNILFDSPKGDEIGEDELHQLARLTDFGLARKIVDDQSVTAAAAMLGTPAYMAPEQATGQLDEIGTHTDVFALGCVLYELLEGASPFRRESPLATLQAVRNEEPKSLRNHPAVSRDLEAIVAKCLEKEWSNRYQSAAHLRDDLNSYLDGRPVTARYISAPRRFARFAVRNPLLSAASLVAVALAITLGVGSCVAAYQLSQSERLAQQEAANMRAVSDFLGNEIVGLASPFLNPNRDMTLLEALDAASFRLEGYFADRPLVEAKIRQTLGKTYFELANFDAALKHLTRAEFLFRTERGAHDEETLNTRFWLSYLELDSGSVELATNAFRTLLHDQSKHLGDRNHHTLRSMGYLAYCLALQRKYSEAEPFFARASHELEVTLGSNHPDTLDCLDSLARMRKFEERYGEAQRIHERVLAARKKVLGDTHPQYIDSLSEWADVKRLQGYSEEAATIFRQVVKLRQKIMGEDHPVTLGDTGRLARATKETFDFSLAESYYRETLGAERTRFGVDDERTLSTMRSLANLYHQQGRHSESIDLYGQVLESRLRVLGETHGFTTNAMSRLASVLITDRQFQRAISLRKQVAELLQQHHGRSDPRVAEARRWLAHGLQEAGRYEEAEQLIAMDIEWYQQRHGIDHEQTLAAIMRKAFVDKKQSNYREAADSFQTVWERGDVLGEDNTEWLRAGNQLGAMLLRLGKTHEANPIIEDVLDRRRRLLGSFDDDIAYSLRELGKWNETVGDLEAAESAYRERARIYLTARGCSHERTGSALRDWHNIAKQTPSAATDSFSSEVAKSMVVEIRRFDSNPAASLRLWNNLFEFSVDDAVSVFDPSQLDGFIRRLKQTDCDTEFLRRIVYRAQTAESFELAEKLANAFVDLETLEHGPDGAETLAALKSWAYVFKAAKRHAKTLSAFQELRRRQTAVMGHTDAGTIHAGHEIARALEKLQRHEEASSTFQDLLQTQDALSEDHAKGLNTLLLYSEFLVRQKQLEKAAPILSLYLVKMRGVRTTPDLNVGRRVWAAVLAVARRYESNRDCESELKLFRACADLMKATFGDHSKEHADSLGLLASCFEKLGDWRNAHATRAYELTIRRTPNVQANKPLHCEMLLAKTLYRLGRLDEAELLIRENIAARERLHGALEGNRLVDSCELLIRILCESNKLEEAELILQQRLLSRTAHDYSRRRGESLTRMIDRIRKSNGHRETPHDEEQASDAPQ